MIRFETSCFRSSRVEVREGDGTFGNEAARVDEFPVVVVVVGFVEEEKEGGAVENEVEVVV